MQGVKLYKGQHTAREYADCAVWCNLNNAVIEDVGEYYEVMALPVPSDDEVHRDEMKVRIAELQNYLCSTDWYCIRNVDIGVDIPAEIKAQRQAAREEIDSLRKQVSTQEEAEISS